MADIESHFGVRLKKLPISYHIDALMEKDARGCGWIEVKRRNCTFDQYPDIMLSVLKLNAGLSLVNATGLPFFFAVKFNDASGLYQWSPSHILDIRNGGRTVQTRDSADIEPVVHIPMSLFDRW